MFDMMSMRPTPLNRMRTETPLVNDTSVFTGSLFQITARYVSIRSLLCLQLLIVAQEPIVPGSLEHAHAKALQYAKKADEFKAIPELMPRVPNTEFMKRPQSKVVKVERPGRAALEFVDVGAKFMDVNERIKRIAAAGRRSARRQSKKSSWRTGASVSS